jgi:hypothetical protein
MGKKEPSHWNNTMVYDERIRIKSWIQNPLYLTWLVLLISPSGWSNDGAAGFDSVGLILFKKSVSIAMISEELNIGSKIRIHYTFKNTSATDVTETVAFPIPELCKEESGGSLSDSGLDFDVNSRNPMNLKVSVDQKDQSVEIEKTWKKGSHGTNCLHFTYYWRQTFPSAKVVDVVQSYEPRNWADASGRFQQEWNQFLAKTPVKDAGMTREFKDTRERYCMDTDLDQQYQIATHLADEPLVFVEGLKYILTTANTWSGPISDFSIKIEPENARWVSTCWKGLKGQHTKTLSWKTKNFTPTQEIELLFVRLAKD